MAVRLRALRELRRAQSGLFSRYGPASFGCPSQPAAPCRWSSSDGAVNTKDKKPYYITTPIFYVNAAPHIGHLFTMVLSDVYKRWAQLGGQQAFLCTGTDEHGMKIQRAAAKEGVQPKEFCDQNSQKFRELAEVAGISHDFFIRTTDPEHKEAVKQFWLNLKHTLPEKLGLYKGQHKGWYCVSDECFYPADVVVPMIDPQTGRKYMGNTETDKEVEWAEEETWFFPLTKYKDALLKFYDENPGWVEPHTKMNEVRAWVENSLEDLSITRPASRLSWGIPDPEDSNHTIYVWVDALVNYLTTTGYGPKWQSPTEDMGLWPADLQVIGKDILRFHAVYWPALLLALGLPPAKQILCHGHWTMSNQKMSKSLGNVVDPIFAMQRWDLDTLRYFLVCNSHASKDMQYSNELIEVDYEKHLRANMGNLFYRVVHSKVNSAWSTKEAVEAYRNGTFKLPEVVEKIANAAEDYRSLEPHFAAVREEFFSQINKLAPGRAVRSSFDFMRHTNRYISETKPWELVKYPNQRDLLNWVIFNCSEALRINAILLQPVIPDKATRMLDELGVKTDQRTAEFARWGADAEYGVPTNYQLGKGRIDPYDTLFPPMTDSKKPTTDLASNARRLKAFHGNSPNTMNQAAAYLGLEAKIGEEAAAAKASQFPLYDTRK